MKEIFATLFEFGGSFATIAADDLYEYGYAPVGFIMIIIVLLSVLGYYKAFDRPRFHRWWHWLTVLSITAFLLFIIAWLYVAGAFRNEGLDYSLFDYFEFLIAVVLYSAVLFFLLSLPIKQFSVNRRKTPF